MYKITMQCKKRSCRRTPDTSTPKTPELVFHGTSTDGVVEMLVLTGEEAAGAGKARGEHREQTGVPSRGHVGEQRQARVNLIQGPFAHQ